jgi:hypothetical protein
MKNCKPLASVSKQQGFSLLTGFLLVITLFGALAFFLAGRGINTAFGTTYANSSKASNLLSSAAYLRTGFDSVVLAGSSPASVTFDDTATTGIFNINTGAATAQKIDPSVLATATPASGEGIWIYGLNAINMTSVGTTTEDYTILVAGLKTGICQQLNYTVNGTPLTTTPTALTDNLGAIVGTADVSTTPTTTIAANTITIAAGGNPSGCYTTADGSNIFIHTVYPQ